MSDGTAFDRVVDAARTLGHVVKLTGSHTASIQCPAHDDTNPSLSIRQIQGSVLVKCHAGCDITEIVCALGLTLADLYDNRRETTYRYGDGRMVHRSPTKRFRQSGNTKGTSLFHVEKVSSASSVFVVEGEQDVLAIESEGGVAVSPAMGAGKASRFDWEPLRDKEIVIVADDDKPGRKHAREVADLLAGIAKSIQIVQAKAGKDSADHLTLGFGLDEFVPVPDDELPAASGGRVIALVRASSVSDDVPDWVWSYGGKGRIQRGTLALFAGRPGAGKSTALRKFAADLTRGRLEGIWHGQPQRIAYVAPAEESVKFVIKPGLRAHDADLDLIEFPEVRIDGQTVPLLSPVDEHELTQALLAAGVTAVLVDPLMSTIGSKVDINRNNEVREYLEPWARIADRLGGIVIGVVHLTKAPNGDVLAAINGSSAFGEVARAVFGFAKDPDSEQDQRIMSQAKNSTGEEDLSLAYRIDSGLVTTDSGRSAKVGKFVILGRSERTVSDVLRGPGGMAGSSLIDDATAWLREYLEREGRTRSRDVKRDAQNAEGYSESTMKRAAIGAGVITESSGFPRATYWSLPVSPAVGSTHNPELTDPTDPTRSPALARANTTYELTKPTEDIAPPVGSVGPVGSPPRVELTADPTENCKPGTDPRCRVCGKPVVGKQGHSHFSCQPNESTEEGHVA